jgi:MFS family permease
MATTATRPDDTRLPVRLLLPIALGTLLQPLNSSMIAVALVPIRAEFHSGAATSWLISGLYLATAVGAPTMGRLADLLGPRRVFLTGAALVGIAATAAVFAPSTGWLIAARVLLGLGSAAPYPAGLAMIRAEADRRGVGGAAGGGLGVLAVAGQVTVALGPTLGGLLVQFAGWRGVFLVNLPFVLVAAFFAVRCLPADRDRARLTDRDRPADRDRAPSGGGGGVWRRLDVPGMVLFTAAMAALMLVLLSLADHPRWSLAPVVLVLAGALVWWELRAARPFLDVRLLAGNRPLANTYLRTAVTYVAFYSIFYGLPGWLAQGRGLDPAKVGLVLLPVASLGAVTVVLATRLERRTGPVALLVIGSAVLLAGGLALTGVGAGTPVLALVGLAALLGVPNGFNSLGNQTSLYLAAPADQMGGASGLYRTSQYVGANLAAAVIELCYLDGQPSDAGLHRLGLVIGAISAVLLVAALLAWRRRQRQEPGSLTSR